MARQACLVLELDLEVIVPLSARYSAEKTDLTKCSFSLGNRQHANLVTSSDPSLIPSKLVAGMSSTALRSLLPGQ